MVDMLGWQWRTSKLLVAGCLQKSGVWQMKIVIEGSFRYPEPRGKPTDMIVGKLSVTSAHRNATTSHAQKKREWWLKIALWGVLAWKHWTDLVLNFICSLPLKSHREFYCFPCSFHQWLFTLTESITWNYPRSCRNFVLYLVLSGILIQNEMFHCHQCVCNL